MPRQSLACLVNSPDEDELSPPGVAESRPVCPRCAEVSSEFSGALRVHFGTWREGPASGEQASGEIAWQDTELSGND